MDGSLEIFVVPNILGSADQFGFLTRLARQIFDGKPLKPVFSSI